RRAYQQILLRSVRIAGGSGGGGLATGRHACFEFELTGLQRATSCAFVINDHFGLPIASFDSNIPSLDDETEASLGDRFVCEIGELPLAPGRYRVDAIVRGNGHLQDGIEGAAYFDVSEGTLAGRPVTGHEGAGAAVIPHLWRLPPS